MHQRHRSGACNRERQSGNLDDDVHDVAWLGPDSIGPGLRQIAGSGLYTGSGFWRSSTLLSIWLNLILTPHLPSIECIVASIKLFFVVQWSLPHARGGLSSAAIWPRSSWNTIYILFTISPYPSIVATKVTGCVSNNSERDPVPGRFRYAYPE